MHTYIRSELFRLRDQHALPPRALEGVYTFDHFYHPHTNDQGIHISNSHTHTYPLQLTVAQVLDFIVGNGFNAIRLPFSLAMALDLGKVNTQWLMDEGACLRAYV